MTLASASCSRRTTIPAEAPHGPIRKARASAQSSTCIGPLANPAGVKRQLSASPGPIYVPVYAEALRLLGTERAMIVSGDEGLDELSIAGTSRFASIGFDLGHDIIAPEGAGLSPPSAVRNPGRRCGV
jgi:anthranilate phosphoribosyltransferase